MPSKRVPLSDIEKTPEYGRLTKKQRLFISLYIGGEYDPVAATLAAYKVKDRQTAQRMSYAIMHNIKIVEILIRHFGAQPIRAFRVMLHRAVRNKHITTAQVKVLQLKAEILASLAA